MRTDIIHGAVKLGYGYAHFRRIWVMATYYDTFGAMPEMTVHLIERMNEVGISPAQLTIALNSQAHPGTSPGTIRFIAGGVTAVVDEDTGDIITVW